MKEWMEALYIAVILALTDLRYLVSFPRYGRLKKKCWYKQICNGTYLLLLTGHFGPVFIRPSQWSITAVMACQDDLWLFLPLKGWFDEIAQMGVREGQFLFKSGFLKNGLPIVIIFLKLPWINRQIWNGPRSASNVYIIYSYICPSTGI